MSQEDIVLPRPQDGSYVSMLCELLGDIQSFPSASSMAGYPFLRLEWRLHNFVQGHPGKAWVGKLADLGVRGGRCQIKTDRQYGGTESQAYRAWLLP